MSWFNPFLIIQGDPDKEAHPHLQGQLKPQHPANAGVLGGLLGASCLQLPTRFSDAVVYWLSLQRPTSLLNLLIGDT